jgi:YebC/PmpR family DNA-binding regulatory protein
VRCPVIFGVLQLWIGLGEGGRRVSGHSKWANIKHKKARVDAHKGKLFTKIGRELIMAAKAGGGDPNGNIRLKMAIQKAKEANMPADNIQRAIQRGTGEIEGAIYEEIMYEGYAAGGVAVMIQIATDNRNRTAADIRHMFSRSGGNLGESGCVAWIFERKGLLVIDPEGPQVEEDELLLLALDAGAEDVRAEENAVEIVAAPDDFEKVREILVSAGLQFAVAEVTMIPQNTIPVTDKEQVAQVIKLITMLEEHDDVQGVYANFDIPEELMAEF